MQYNAHDGLQMKHTVYQERQGSGPHMAEALFSKATCGRPKWGATGSAASDTARTIG